ncbi:Uma2 family endonuclease [Streptomyces sp. NPDC054849]
MGRARPSLGGDGRAGGLQGGDHRGDRHRGATAGQRPQLDRGVGAAPPVHGGPRRLGHPPDPQRGRPEPQRPLHPGPRGRSERGDPHGGELRSAAAAELVVEITSRSNAVNDRVSKLKGYAAAGIPLYLLIDPHATGSPTIHLYGEPTDGKYRLLHAGKFGEAVHLPEPFDLTLDTFGYPRP